jgi:dTDP-glucose pyrophosphorylase
VSVAPFPRQCAILVGGRGTRLGSLTAAMPKPLLDCGGRPFLAWILRELSRFGISEVVLLAGYHAPEVAAFVERTRFQLPKPMRIALSCEPSPAGTGGALRHAQHLLDERFLLINGDSWFDTNLAHFIASAPTDAGSLIHILLREAEDTTRYGVVELSDNLVRKFHDRAAGTPRGIMNAGLYLVSKGALDFTATSCSLEKDVLPELARLGSLTGSVADGYFIDIGTPPDYTRANIELPRRLRRPAAFFYLGCLLRAGTDEAGMELLLNKGAREAMLATTEAGFHVFVTGAASEIHSDRDLDVSSRVSSEVRTLGGTVDDIRCGAEYRSLKASALRELASAWEIELDRSFLVSNNQTDIAVAKSAAITGHLLPSEDVRTFVSALLADAL